MQLCLGQLNCKTAVKIRLACYSKKSYSLCGHAVTFFASCKIVLSVDATVLVCTAALYPTSDYDGIVIIDPGMVENILRSFPFSQYLSACLR